MGHGIPEYIVYYTDKWQLFFNIYVTGLALEAFAGVISLASSEIDQSGV